MTTSPLLPSTLSPPLEILHSPPEFPVNAPPLIFVHGAFCGAWVWQEHFLDWFSARGFDCRAVSLRGHGGSGDLGDLHSAGVQDYVDDVRRVMADLDRPPVIIGHSMGGMIVQRLIESWDPRRFRADRPIAGAVLMASVPPGGLWGTTWHMATHTPHLLWALAEMQTFGTAAAPPEHLHRALFAGAVPLDLTHRYLARFQSESLRAQMEMTFSPPPVATNGKSIPLLVVGATEDSFVPPWMARTTARHYDAPCQIINGMGHAMMLEPDWPQVAERLHGWLEETGLAPASAPT